MKHADHRSVGPKARFHPRARRHADAQHAGLATVMLHGRTRTLQPKAGAAGFVTEDHFRYLNEVRFPPDYVCSTSNSRHSLAQWGTYGCDPTRHRLLLTPKAEKTLNLDPDKFIAAVRRRCQVLESNH